MIISEELKYIFISNPKTGTTTIQKYLQELDANSLQNQMPKKYPQDIISGINEHITANELAKRMGKDYYAYKTFIFIRNPYDKAVSGYFFYQNGKVIFNRTNKRYYLALANIILARVLPFSVWSLVKPIKTNREYLVDNNSRCLVNYIGKTASLNEDLLAIAKTLGIELQTPKNEIIKVNTSKRESDFMKYFKSKWHKKLFDKKYKRDVDLYNNILKIKDPSYDWKGTVL